MERQTRTQLLDLTILIINDAPFHAIVHIPILIHPHTVKRILFSNTCTTNYITFSKPPVYNKVNITLILHSFRTNSVLSVAEQWLQSYQFRSPKAFLDQTSQLGLSHSSLTSPPPTLISFPSIVLLCLHLCLFHIFLPTGLYNFPRHFRQMLGQYLDEVTDSSFHILTSPSFIKHSTTEQYTG